MTRQQTLASVLRDTSNSFKRYLKGFDDSTAVRQAPQLPNHLIWTLGHLAITLYRGATKIDGIAPPESAFIDAEAGDSLRFGTKSIGFGSLPKADPALYPPLARAISIYDDGIDRLARAAETADDATLDKLVPWGAGTTSAASLVGRMVFHNGTHCGQIVDLRRALGMPSALS